MAVDNINKQMVKTPMSELPVGERITCFDEVALGYTEDEACNEAQRCAHCKNPGCMQQCPAHNNIPEFIAHVVAGEYLEAYDVLRRTSAFPGVCSRICAQELQCESGCLRGRNNHQPVAIGRLERFVADYAAAHGYAVDKTLVDGPDLQDVSVAVIGAGPAGIAAATDLVELGADVTVIESDERAGGILTYGIPEFCLPAAVVDGYVDDLARRGVSFELGTTVDDVASLIADRGFDAVVLGQGAELPRKLGVEGETLCGVYDSADFLARAAVDPASVNVGRTCVVIGGGNTAIDVARTALRLGAEVTVVYRRGRAEMPARQEEVKHAEEEGIKFQFLTAQSRFIDDGAGALKAVEFVKMELTEPGEDGRRSVVPIEGSQFTVDVDTVVSAAGSVADPLIPQATEGLEVDRRNFVLADRYVGMTSIPGVFAGGDAVTGPATVVEAMVAGKRAAKGVRRYIYGRRH